MDRKAMYKLSYGLFVLTAKEDEKDNGCIINTAIQAASEPNQLSICVNKANYTHDMIQRTGKFTVSVLSQNAQFELFKHFGFQSGRNVNKFEAFEKCARGSNGIYYVTEGTNAYISVTVNKTEDLGSHTMFMGEITDMEVLSNVPSVTYDYYQNNIKPKPQAVGKTEDGQTIWRCRICGYEMCIRDSGKTGKNFAAGMSGGIAYVLDVDNVLYKNLNKAMISIEKVENKYDKKELRDLIEAHVEATGSKLGAKVLADFDYYLPHFKKLIPNEYKKMITLSAKLEEKGLNSQQAQMEAFYESIGAKH